MKKFIALAITIAASAAYGQGTVNLSNNVGAKIFPIFAADGTTVLSGAGYSIGVYKAGTSDLLGLGAVSPNASGRFNAGTGAAIPGVAAGAKASLVVRAWDNAGGTINSYAAAVIKGESAPFSTGTLGGDPDGDGPLLPITPIGMVVEGVGGFTSFSITAIPEPTTIALGAIGAAALLIRRRK
jgi:hypothetical protein